MNPSSLLHLSSFSSFPSSSSYYYYYYYYYYYFYYYYPYGRSSANHH